MRDRALVVMTLVWAAACGKVHSLSDGGTPDAPGFDASTTTCDSASCSLTSDGCCPSVCNATDDADCAPVCGNSAIESGETCDPLSSCPTDCPAIGCQLRTLAGAGTCAAACADAGTINLCSEGSDGCCPTNCDASNDIDCAAVCDNGVKEPGEQCDPLASCPTSCPQQGCQLYDLFNGGTCQAQCVAGGQQTQCVNNDGCCPGACNANNDNDCSPSCGNGVLESGETCDPPASCGCPAEAYTCYTTAGGAATCDLVCHVPVTTCNIDGDGCCAFETKSQAGCDSTTDKECTGPRWAYKALRPVDTTTGCTTHRLGGFVAGGSYLFTTCVPSGTTEGTGDPYVKAVVDDKGTALDGGNDNCDDPTALPNEAGWSCKAAAGLVMSCSPMNPGGFILKTTPAYVDVTVCPNKPGVAPLYVWYNAPQAPNDG